MVAKIRAHPLLGRCSTARSIVGWRSHTWQPIQSRSRSDGCNVGWPQNCSWWIRSFSSISSIFFFFLLLFLNYFACNFQGFSSALSYRTSPDPSRSVLPARAVIKSIDRIKGPFDPSNIEYLEKDITWEAFKQRLQKLMSYPSNASGGTDLDGWVG